MKNIPSLELIKLNPEAISQALSARRTFISWFFFLLIIYMFKHIRLLNFKPNKNSQIYDLFSWFRKSQIMLKKLIGWWLVYWLRHLSKRLLVLIHIHKREAWIESIFFIALHCLRNDIKWPGVGN